MGKGLVAVVFRRGKYDYGPLRFDILIIHLVLKFSSHAGCNHTLHVDL